VRRQRTSNALGIFVLVLLSLQIFLVTVAVEALQTDEDTLGWTTAAFSVALFVGAVAFARYLRSSSTGT
jgi:hypothetical protein